LIRSVICPSKKRRELRDAHYHDMSGGHVALESADFE
jgi:hypothetical protein